MGLKDLALQKLGNTSGTYGCGHCQTTVSVNKAEVEFKEKDYKANPELPRSPVYEFQVIHKACKNVIASAVVFDNEVAA